MITKTLYSKFEHKMPIKIFVSPFSSFDWLWICDVFYGCFPDFSTDYYKRNCSLILSAHAHDRKVQ